MRIKSKAILLATASMITFSSIAMADDDFERAALPSKYESQKISDGFLLAMLQEENDHDDHDEDEHDDHDDHGDHDEDDHDDHDDHEEGAIRLSPADMDEFGIRTGQANGDVLQATVRLSGEVVLNDNLAAHIVPRVSGNVRKVLVNLGDRVEEGQALAELESRELADVKADYVAARERASLANTNFERYQRLWDQKITSEQEYLEVRNVFRESEIVLKASEQKLFALDVSPSDLVNLSSGNGHQLTHFELKAPLGGEVIERNIARGEFIGPDSPAFIVADLSTVWVDLTVYEAQLSLVRANQKVVVTSRYGNVRAEGSVEYVSPVVDPVTRTATARVILDNSNGEWPPGTFVDAVIAVNSIKASVVIPRDAVQTIDNESVVFVQEGDVFETTVVQLGRQNDSHVEIVSGLQLGQTYVARNAFALKAELGRSGLEHAGHAH